jgi:hypothetical protein
MYKQSNATPSKANNSLLTFSKTKKVTFNVRESEAMGLRSSSTGNINTTVVRHNWTFSNINITSIGAERACLELSTRDVERWSFLRKMSLYVKTNRNRFPFNI